MQFQTYVAWVFLKGVVEGGQQIAREREPWKGAGEMRKGRKNKATSQPTRETAAWATLAFSKLKNTSRPLGNYYST